MQTQFYSLSLARSRAWLVATAFVSGNILIPQLIHLIPQGGLIFLPIYFFTLIGAYKYGTQVGVLTAVVSPLVNSALVGMPVVAMLPIIMLKGVLLAVFAGYAAQRVKKADLLTLAAVVLSYQAVGCAIEAIAAGSILTGIQDFRIGFPGMLLQVFGGWVIINKVFRR